MGLTLQPAARRDLVDVAINVDLQQRARMIGWTSGRFWNHTVKAQRPEIQLIDKHVDHPHRVVLSNVVIQILGKQNALYTVFTLDEARHLIPPARIIQNYNSTGVFTQPRPEAEVRSRLLCASSRTPLDATRRPWTFRPYHFLLQGVSMTKKILVGSSPTSLPTVISPLTSSM